MRKKQKNINFLKVNNDERSSLFVVDLKESETADELVNSRISKNKIKENFIRVFDKFVLIRKKVINIFAVFKKLKKIKAFEAIKFYVKLYPSQPPLKKYKEKGRSIESPYVTLSTGRQEAPEDKLQKYLKRFDDFAFLVILKILIIFFAKLGNVIYKISYKVGWYLIYGVRFIVLLISSVALKSLPIVRQAITSLYSFITTSPLAMKQQTVKDRKKINKKKKVSKNYLETFKSNISFIFDFFKANLNFKKSAYIKVSDEKLVDKSSHAKVSADRFEFPGSSLEDPILNISIRKSVLKFALILFIIILPFKVLSYKSLSIADLKGRVLGASEQAINNLRQAGGSVAMMDFSEASSNFSKASDNFLKAQSEISEINNIFFSLLKIIPNQEAKFASESKNILEGGRIASELGDNLSLAIESIYQNKDKNLIEIIDGFVFYGKKAIDNIDELNKVIKEININNLPTEYREQFASIKEKSNIIENGLKEIIEMADEMKVFLGSAYDKRYLLVFQNNTEMRATGGFIGSYALVDFSNGRLKNLEVPGGGSYDTEGGLSVLVQAPKPMHLVNALWHFWDANWWPDWKKSAKKLMWFYEKSDGPTVDGVISFTPTVLEDLLKIIGPINMTEKYGVIVDSENFWLTAQSIVENKDTIYQIDGNGKNIENNTPKKLIGDLMEKIIEELPSRLDKEKFIKIFARLESNLNKKHILFYFNDDKLQSEIEKHGWDGELRDFKWDYLSVINTNIAGGKSDKMIKENIDLQTDVMKDGSIINTLKIKRTHTGEKKELFTGVRNVDWIRVYVPIGSELLETSGFTKPDEIYFDEVDPTWQYDDDLLAEENSMKEFGEDKTKIYYESGKTVFANWSMVDPGKTSEITIRYKLPFVIEKKEVDKGWAGAIEKFVNPGKKKLMPYAIYFQKQSGSIGSEINYALNLPDNLELVVNYPQKINSSNNKFLYSGILETDKYSAFLIGEK